MSRKFCPKCGKDANKLYDGLCSECFLTKFNFAEKLPDKLSVRNCKECGKFFNEEKSFKTLEDGIEAHLKHLKNKEIESISYRVANNKLIVTLHSKINGLKKKEEKTLQFNQPKILCKFCSMKVSGYFTSIMQLRGKFDKELVMKEIDWLMKRLESVDETAFISKIVEKGHGVDLYFGSKTAANKIAKYFKERYKTRNKLSSTLYGTKLGKRLFRDTVLVLFGESENEIRGRKKSRRS